MGTKNCSEAEEIVKTACNLFMQIGLCSRKCLIIIHETEQEEFFLLKKEKEYPQIISVSKNSIEKYNFHLPEKSEKIPLYKEEEEYKLSFYLIKEQSSDQTIFTINTKKKKKKKKKAAMDLVTKILHITSKACSYSIPPIHVFCLKKQTVTNKKRK